MLFSDIEIGMTVRYKSYEEIGNMNRSARGENPVRFGFYSDMKFLCGTEAVVTGIGNEYGDQVIVLDPRPIKDGFTYTISADMLDPVIEEMNIPDDFEVPDISILL